MKKRDKYLLVIVISIFAIVSIITSIKHNKVDNKTKDVVVTTDDLQPIKANVNGINVMIDPRIELLSAVILISDYDTKFDRVTKENFSYKTEMKNYFSKYANHEVVETFNNLNARGFSYHRPPEVMMYLSNPLSLAKNQEFDYNVMGSLGSEELEKFIVQLRKFAVDTNFKEFYTKNAEFYKKVIEKNIKIMGDFNYLGAVEKYYGMKKRSYNIILSSLFHNGGYGTNIKNKDGNYDIYSFQGPDKVENDIPILGGQKEFRRIAFHEFSHSFVNLLTEENIDEVNKYSKLLDPISISMNKQAYGDWGGCVNEHIIRAITSRLAYIYDGDRAYKDAILHEKSYDFYYVEPLAKKLEEFENNRNKYKSFKEFYPELIKVFKELSEKKLGAEFYKIKFEGPINCINVMKNNKIIILPTNEKNKEAEKSVHDFVNKEFEKYKPNVEIITDDEALNRNLKDYDLMVYGTIEGNKLLAKYGDGFPFKITKKQITMDKAYDGENLRLITAIPSVANKNNCMIIYTAQNIEDVIGINDLRGDGSKDFIIFDGKNEISSGYYSKENDNWGFK